MEFLRPNRLVINLGACVLSLGVSFGASAMNQGQCQSANECNRQMNAQQPCEKPYIPTDHRRTKTTEDLGGFQIKKTQHYHTKDTRVEEKEAHVDNVTTGCETSENWENPVEKCECPEGL